MLGGKLVFAVRGTDCIIDDIEVKTMMGIWSGETLEQVRKRYPGAEIVDFDKFCDEKNARQLAKFQAGKWEEITEEKYWYFLKVVPPARTRDGDFLIGEAIDSDGNGRPRYRACKKTDDKFFTFSEPMTTKQFEGNT